MNKKEIFEKAMKYKKLMEQAHEQHACVEEGFFAERYGNLLVEIVKKSWLSEFVEYQCIILFGR